MPLIVVGNDIARAFERTGERGGVGELRVWTQYIALYVDEWY